MVVSDRDAAIMALLPVVEGCIARLVRAGIRLPFGLDDARQEGALVVIRTVDRWAAEGQPQGIALDKAMSRLIYCHLRDKSQVERTHTRTVDEMRSQVLAQVAHA